MSDIDPFDFSHYGDRPQGGATGAWPGGATGPRPADQPGALGQPPAVAQQRNAGSSVPGWPGVGPSSSPGMPAASSSQAAFADPMKGVDATSDLALGKPPAGWLIACAVVVVAAGLVAGLLGNQPRMAIASWVASGPVAIGLLGAFTTFDTRQRARPTYSERTWVKVTYVLCLALCAAAVCTSAVRVALWVGRL